MFELNLWQIEFSVNLGEFHFLSFSPKKLLEIFSTSRPTALPKLKCLFPLFKEVQKKSKDIFIKTKVTKLDSNLLVTRLLARRTKKALNYVDILCLIFFSFFKIFKRKCYAFYKYRIFYTCLYLFDLSLIVWEHKRCFWDLY